MKSKQEPSGGSARTNTGARATESGSAASPAETERTLIIPGDESTEGNATETHSALTDPLEMATETVGSKTGTLGETSLVSVTPRGSRSDTSVDRNDTEEVFVILPEDDQDAVALPVVETQVVDDVGLDAGPSSTEVLRHSPTESGPSPASTQELASIPLKKSNPLRPGSTEEIDVASVRKAETEVLEAQILAANGGKQGAADDEIRVIDEIADLASDIGSSGGAKPDTARPTEAVDFPRAEESDAPAKSGRGARTLFLVGSLAALVAVGVFFQEDLLRVYEQYVGGGSTGNSGASAQALTQPSPASGGALASANEAESREHLQERVSLAFRIGLAVTPSAGTPGKE